jgi:uncharacterized protein
MEFESLSGQTYYYDNEIGIAFPSNPLMKKLISANPRQMEEIAATEKNKEDFLFYSRFIEKLNRIRLKNDSAKPRLHINADDIKPLLMREGLHQIILGVTENCNMRCRYCIYSETYSLSRKRTRKKMDFPTAKKALDYYVSLFLEGQEYNPTRQPAVSFYGGEPLLNFDLKKECVLYLETTHHELDFLFSFTTNGTLLTQEKDDFLVEHGFFVNFSIDGPEKEHNRKRVYPGNKGTFSDVMKNARRFMKKKSDKCGAMCVFDYKSNPFDLDAFFSRPDVPRLGNITLPNDRNGCNYYDQFSREDIAAYRKTITEAFRYYLENGAHDENEHSFFFRIFPESASRFLYSPSVLNSRERMIFPYSGACIPGKKIFVDCSGNFHACERMNEYFPIGNVGTGLDFQNIANLINRYNEHLDSCGSCSINRTCGKCYTRFATDGSFENASTVCKNEEDLKKIEFSRVFTIGEVCPDLLNIMVNDHYTWLSRVPPASGD